MPDPRTDNAKALEQLAEEVLLIVLQALRDFFDGKARFVINDVDRGSRVISFKRDG